MMYLFTLIYDVLVYSQIIHSTNPTDTRIGGDQQMRPFVAALEYHADVFEAYPYP